MRMASGQYLILTETPVGPKGYPMSRLIPWTAFRFLRHSCELEGRACPAQPARHSQWRLVKRPKAGRPAETKELTWMIRRDT